MPKARSFECLGAKSPHRLLLADAVNNILTPVAVSVSSGQLAHTGTVGHSACRRRHKYLEMCWAIPTVRGRQMGPGKGLLTSRRPTWPVVLDGHPNWSRSRDINPRSRPEGTLLGRPASQPHVSHESTLEEALRRL